jgi:hypothetical protein
MIPGVGDTEESLGEVVGAASDAGAEFVLFGSMSVRAEQKERIYDLLRMHYPHLLKMYDDLYPAEAQHEWPHDDEYLAEVYQRAHNICRKMGMPERIPRYIPEGAIPENLKVSTLLFEMAYFMQLKNIPHYKVDAYRRAARSIEEMDTKILSHLEEGRLTDIPGVGPVISRDITEILKKGTSELYENLKK